MNPVDFLRQVNPMNLLQPKLGSSLQNECVQILVMFPVALLPRPKGPVYTMFHEVDLRGWCDWLLNLSRDHFGLHQGKKWQGDNERRGPQNIYLKDEIIHWHDLTGCIAVRERQESGMVGKGKGMWQRIAVMKKFQWIFFWGVGCGWNDGSPLLQNNVIIPKTHV